jgi:D-3-phosphoglycerate dehydrogenase / 2-oxoglutarate reductase
MAKFKVVAGKLTGPFAKMVNGYDLEREALDPIDAEVVMADPANEDEMLAQLKDADAVIGMRVKLTPDVLASMGKCKIISGSAVGFDYVDIPAATKAGIVVTNVPDTFIEEVADHAMMLLLASWRRVITQDRMVREDRWSEGRRELSNLPRLRGLTLGFISFGNIPRLVSKRAKAFGLNVIAFDPFIQEHFMHEYEVEPVTSLTELLNRSDFVSMHVPLSPATKGMLSDEQFKAMKSTGIFLNTGRGGTVDEPALIKALQDGSIAFAGLDVFEQEPIGTDNALLKMDNVILSAHVASASSRMMPEARRRAGREIAAMLMGRRPLSPINPQVLG